MITSYIIMNNYHPVFSIRSSANYMDSVCLILIHLNNFLFIMFVCLFIYLLIIVLIRLKWRPNRGRKDVYS